MTPTEIETAARRKYNSENSSFYSQAEIWGLIYQAELEIATETKMLEGVDVTLTTTAGTKNYNFPDGTSYIKRVEVNGIALDRIDFRDDDDFTLYNSDNTSQGVPEFFYQWGRVFYLRPIPSTSSQTIRIYEYEKPVAVTSGSQTLEVPDEFHMCIADYVAAEMAYKDENFDRGDRLMGRWDDIHIPRMRRWSRKRRTGSSFNVVKDVSFSTRNSLGVL